MRYVGVARRALAVLIDSLLWVIPASVFADAFHTTHVAGSTSWNFSISSGKSWAVTLLWFAYLVVMEATLGATLGKFVVGIRVVKLDGTPMDFQASLLRNVLRIVDGLFFYLVGAICVWTSPLKQRLGDRVAGTVVVPAGVTVPRGLDANAVPPPPPMAPPPPPPSG